MQITRQQELDWLDDPDSFIQDEEELCCGPRTSGDYHISLQEDIQSSMQASKRCEVNIPFGRT